MIKEKLLHYIASVLGGLLVSFETAIDFFIPCLIAVVFDVISAWSLGRRVHRKKPDKADGKFRSEYKFRIIYTMIIVLFAIILAHYVDILIIKSTNDIVVRFIIGVFLFYEVWSILENCSSESENKLAKILQRFMIDKAERHFNVEINDILNDKK